ncbi:phosphoglycolate phosphatase-like HAD superfamily hydrolase [Halopolyspora algeriensis]|uniref:Phosphoglycolate phosphatase-like HAD superfamily hydrolase n=1 Tax=Halopolyspora algeriensis TaxID=1500506 RepID=A0A368VP53_9ACTN|nr:haloacid dehalogenase-like hydrolase [Halopolyspora algeriensis]RCW43300.1 phosphoglycolate phosphatase-like HAD superfamily hydrolase [Halopolyspora algeriensis]TQM56359.1 phosphoglycolate phosphatase-like HAD superfamily hydrolase [Halopolyspora algeriensis]
MAADGRMRLVLWDIDHTLIESRGMGRSVYARVFPEVTGQSLRELAPVHGRTELDIMHDTLRLHEIEPTERITTRLAAALAEGFRAAVGELAERGTVLPGVWQALDALAAEPDMHQSVLSGNTADVARTKLEAFGLERYLDLPAGAYGDDHRERAELVTIARDRVARQFGTTVPAERIVLIGDTPHDVDVALSAGTHIVAVATGEYSVDDLRAAGAESPLEDLTSLSRLRRALNGDTGGHIR